METGDLDALRDLLEEDVELRSDGGGKVRAALLPIYGRDRVLRFIAGALKKWPGSPLQRRRVLWFNGAPGMLVEDENGMPETAYQFLVVGGRVRAIYAQRNPDKLARLARRDGSLKSAGSEGVARPPGFEPGTVGLEGRRAGSVSRWRPTAPAPRSRARKVGVRDGTPARIRTWDLSIRSRLLYPTELRARPGERIPLGGRGS